MQARLVHGWRSNGGGITNSAGKAPALCATKTQLLRHLTAKVPNRAAVHGLKRPTTHEIINEEEVGKEIEKGKEKIEEKRRGLRWSKLWTPNWTVMIISNLLINFTP